MTSREELIEEADEMYDKIGTSIYREKFREWYLSKFEKAQAPTDDEREALIDVMVMTRLSDYATDMSAIHQAVDAILAAGFRRPAQTEPTEALEKITEVISALSINLNNEAYGKPDAEWGQIQRQLQGVEFAYAALKAAFTAGQEEQS